MWPGYDQSQYWSHAQQQAPVAMAPPGVGAYQQQPPPGAPHPQPTYAAAVAGSSGQPPPGMDTNSAEYATWYASWMAHHQAQQAQMHAQQAAASQHWHYQQQQMHQHHHQQQQQAAAAAASTVAAAPVATVGAIHPAAAAKPQFVAVKPVGSAMKDLKANASVFLASSKNKPAFIPVSVKPTPTTNAFSNGVSEEKPESKKDAKAGSWPDSLKRYVTKVFSKCGKDNRDHVEKGLKELIASVSAKNSLHEVDWDKMELPRECRTPTPPPPESTIKRARSPGASPLTTPDLRSVPSRKKRKNIPVPDVDSDFGTPEPSEPDDSLAHLPPHIRNEEIRRRELRARRFQEAAEEERKRLKRKQEDSKRARTAALRAGAEGNPDVIDWDEHTIVGVCTKLEKHYLRLTSAPDPSTVRPLRILRQTLELLGRKWKEEQNYTYICDQFKSLRQDLTVQRIKNEFTVRVYEAHARIALEKGDIGEYNQCQAQIKELYRLGLPGCVDEFLGYRILYFVYTRNRTDQVKIISELTDAEKIGPSVRHALQVRTAVVTGDYHSLFQLYNTAPQMSIYLMDFFIELERFKALRIMAKAYRPNLAVEFIARELGWVHPEDDTAGQKDATDVCRGWLKSHAVPFDKEDRKGLIDCKGAAIVMTAKVQELDKKGVDIKGQIY